MPVAKAVKKPKYPHKTGTYSFDFTKDQREEIESLPLVPDNFGEGIALPRNVWLGIAYQSLGKALRIGEGAYGESGEDEGVDCEAWAEEMRDIASTILDFFQPGDGQI